MLRTILTTAAVALLALPAAASAREPQFRVVAATITQSYTHSTQAETFSSWGSETATLHATRSRWSPAGALEAKLRGPVSVSLEATEHGQAIHPCRFAFDAREVATRLLVSWSGKAQRSGVELAIDSGGFDDHRVCSSRAPMGVLAGEQSARVDQGRFGRARVVDVRGSTFTVQTSGSYSGGITQLGELGGFPATDRYSWTATVRIQRR